VDLRPHLSGELTSAPHEQLYWRRFVAGAVREGDWKLIRVREEDGSFREPILVDLASDPGEEINRAGDEPERAARMRADLELWEAGLAEPRWREGAIWEKNQRKKHELGLLGREAERALP
jgi:arylsulfatase A-like enzyme